jgi:hypothetical protein
VSATESNSADESVAGEHARLEEARLQAEAEHTNIARVLASLLFYDGPDAAEETEIEFLHG